MSSAGRLCIFNHQNFADNPKLYRYGSLHDVQSLQEVFGKYNVRSKVFNNFTKKQVENAMTKLASFDFTKNSCLVIAILSHGGLNDTILASDQNFYSIQKEIVEPIIGNRTLRGKPKIILVQACKGDKEIQPATDQVDSADTPKTFPYKINPDPDQVYKFYSTTEDFVSYRRDTGSRFIETFCDYLDKEGEKHDIQKIMDNASDEIKQRYGNQVPSKTCPGGNKTYIFGDHAKIK